MATHAIGLLVTLSVPLDEFSQWFYERYDGVVGEHDGQVNVRAYLDTDARPSAAVAALALALTQHGVQVTGLDWDFVNTSDIAERTGRSRQYVAQLVAGAAGPGDFPRHLAVAGRSKIWDWGSVNAWLQRVGLGDEERYLTFAEACEVESLLTKLHMPANHGHTAAPAATVSGFVQAIDANYLTFKTIGGHRGLQKSYFGDLGNIGRFNVEIEASTTRLVDETEAWLASSCE